jgi:prepilin-type processing-associated H-X9-DG protein
MYHLLPFVEEVVLYNQGQSTIAGGGTYYNGLSSAVYSVPVKFYVCPSDPSMPTNFVSAAPGGSPWTDTSYAGNFQVFGLVDPSTGAARTGTAADWQGGARIPSSFQDGTSKTIVIAHRYAECGGTYSNLWADTDRSPWNPVFAASNYPSASGANSTTLNIGPASKFLYLPSPWIGASSVCNPVLAATPHPAGMNVAMADGAVRTLGASIAGQTWWAALTPSANDLVGSDW